MCWFQKSYVVDPNVSVLYNKWGGYLRAKNLKIWDEYFQLQDILWHKTHINMLVYAKVLTTRTLLLTRFNFNHSWITNHMPSSKACDEIVYLFPNLNCCIVEVWEWIRNLTQHSLLDITAYPYWVEVEVVKGAHVMWANITARLDNTIVS